MSGMMHPVGPEDPQVYWMRRATIGVVLVVVVLIIVAFARPGRTAGTAVPTGSPTPLVLSTPTSTPTSSGTPTAAPDATPAAESSAEATSPTEAKTPVAPAACQAADIRVALSGGSGAGIGQKTSFTTQLTNGSSGPCTIGVDKSVFELKVVSGSDRIWSSADCDAWLQAKSPAEVKPGESISVTVDWPGRRSYPGCKLGSKDITAGTYVATAEYRGAATAKKVMGLR